MAIPTIVTIVTALAVCRWGKAVLMGEGCADISDNQHSSFRAGSCADWEKAVLILGPISAQDSVGLLSVTMGFSCDDGVFVWRSFPSSNPVTIGPVLMKMGTIVTGLC